MPRAGEKPAGGRAVWLLHKIRGGGCSGNLARYSSGRHEYYVWWSFPSQEARLRGHSAGVKCVAVGMMDGRSVVVSGDDDQTVGCWDLTTGRQIGEPLTGHTGKVIDVAVGAMDGRLVVVSRDLNNTVRWWDLAIWRPMAEPLTGLMHIAVGTINGRLTVVSGDDDQMVRCWDLGARQPIFTVNLGGSLVHALFITADAQVMVGTGRGLLVLRLHPERIATLFDH